MATYTVKKGDTLSAIGKKYGVSYQDIAKENGISNPNVIYAGQTLNITTPQDNVAPKTNPPTGTNANNKGAAGNTFTTPAGNTYNSFTPEEVTYDSFQESDLSKQAWATLGQSFGNAPASWTDPYADQRKGYLDQYENRDPFSYDFNSDALYQQYKDQYIQQGQMAMMDTMGQAAAMTGGYGNSYAQTVGQQAYNQQLNQLNAIMPELYDRAYGIYQQEGEELLKMYDLYTGLSNESHNQHLGEVDRYYKQLGALSDYANALYSKEFDEWGTMTGLDIDIANAKNNMGLDTWATQLGIISGENQTLMNQKFTAEENQKSRDAAATKDGNITPVYKDLDVGSSAYNTIVSAVKKASSSEELKELVEQWLSLGYDPNQINALTASRAAELAGDSSGLGPWEIKLLQGAAAAPHQPGSTGRYTY